MRSIARLMRAFQASTPVEMVERRVVEIDAPAGSGKVCAVAEATAVTVYDVSAGAVIVHCGSRVRPGDGIRKNKAEKMVAICVCVLC